MLLLQNHECHTDLVKICALCLALEHAVDLCVLVTTDDYMARGTTTTDRNRKSETQVVDSYILAPIYQLKSDRLALRGTQYVESANAFLQFPMHTRFEAVRHVRSGRAEHAEEIGVAKETPLTPLELITSMTFWWQREFRQHRLIRPALIDGSASKMSKRDRVLRLFRIWAANHGFFEGVLFVLQRLNEPSRHDRTAEVKEVLLSVLVEGMRHRGSENRPKRQVKFR